MMFDEQRTRTILGPEDPARGVAVPLPQVSAADLMVRGNPVEVATPTRPNRRVILVAAAATVAAATGATMAIRSIKDAPKTDVPAKDNLATDAGLAVPIAYQIATDPPPAGKYLRELSRRIGSAPYDVHSGRYTYHQTRWWGGAQTTSAEGYTMSFVEDFEVWAAKDGSARRRHRMLPPQYPNEESRRYYESLPSPTPKGTPPPDRPYEDFPPGLVAPTEPLPTGRAQLAKLLVVPREPGSVAKNVGHIYEDYAIPRSTRALILDILADMPGWSWRGEVTDRAGRAGVAITGEDHGQQSVLVFDPKTGVLLAHELVFLSPQRTMGAYQLILAIDRTDRSG